MIKWSELDGQWRIAFNVVLGLSPVEEQPSEAKLNELAGLKVLRLTGPSSYSGNLGFELTHMAPLVHLTELEVLVLTHHQIMDISPLTGLKNLTAIFLHNNKIEDLSPLAQQFGLLELYVQHNAIADLTPLEKLTKLRTLYASNNKITSLNGIGEQHEEELRQFFVLPNEGLRDREVMRFEREAGIRCR